jgi:hypothetical protein
MFLDRQVGALSEPVSGRCWEPEVVLREFARRVQYLQRNGMGPSDRVFLHYGNNLGFSSTSWPCGHSVAVPSRWTLG